MLTLKRNEFLSCGIFGQLMDENLNKLYVTLERAFRVDRTGQASPGISAVIAEYAPAIPVGVYTCKRRFSPHFGYDVFWLTDVPGHDWIEIHIGNFNKDTEGCILLGMFINPVPGRTDGELMIDESAIAFNAFMKRMDGVNQFNLAVI